MTGYLGELVSLIALYTILVAALDLVAGRAGLVSVCHGAFFAVGAYSAAVLTTKHSSVLLAGTVAITLASLLGAAVGAVAARVRAEYFLIVTFGFQIIASALLVNWTAVTRGPMGITGIKRIATTSAANAAVLVAAAIVTVILVRYLAESPYGRILSAIHDDEVFATSLGKNVTLVKTSVFAVSAGLAASAGLLYAHWAQYIAPNTFDINRSILLVSMLVLGGSSTTLGVITGPAVLVLIPELARLLVGGPIAANLQGIFYGVVLIVCVSFRPNGIWGRREFEEVSGR
jgi:branched-chain amino acid transport system permease protein